MSDSPIDRIERWGYPTPEPPPIVCPVCGDECKSFFVLNGEVLGCENCIDEWDSEEWEALNEGV